MSNIRRCTIQRTISVAPHDFARITPEMEGRARLSGHSCFVGLRQFTAFYYSLEAGTTRNPLIQNIADNINVEFNTHYVNNQFNQELISIPIPEPDEDNPFFEMIRFYNSKFEEFRGYVKNNQYSFDIRDVYENNLIRIDREIVHIAKVIKSASGLNFSVSTLE